MKRHDDESGMVTAFVVVFAMALLLFAGLVFDGGSIVAAKREVIDQAQSAARAGAQGLDVDGYRSTGTVILDPVAAKSAAMTYLSDAGAQGTVTVVDDQVHVTVTKDQPMRILGIGGLRVAHVSGDGVARLERG